MSLKMAPLGFLILSFSLLSNDGWSSDSSSLHKSKVIRKITFDDLAQIVKEKNEHGTRTRYEYKYMLTLLTRRHVTLPVLPLLRVVVVLERSESTHFCFLYLKCSCIIHHFIIIIINIIILTLPVVEIFVLVSN